MGRCLSLAERRRLGQRQGFVRYLGMTFFTPKAAALGMGFGCMLATSGCFVLYDFETTSDGTGAASTSTTQGPATTTSVTTGGFANGVNCASDTECSSGHCVQSVCCDTSCTGKCEACDGVSGTSGKCRRLPQGTLCADATCTRDTQVTGQCNGVAADCQTVVVACKMGCDGPTCRGNCANDSQCKSDEYCLGAGQCVKKQAKGASCGAANECASGLCVDGVCCDSGCTEPCMACNVVGSSGTCSVVPDGTAAPADCGTSEPFSCGYNGTCNGDGGCAYYPQSQSCAPGSCANGTMTAERFCSGSGACKPGVTTGCGAYVCDVASCRTNCSGQDHCAPPFACSAAGICALPLGAPCNDASQCASQSCFDGVCCNAVCNNFCTACSAAKKGGGTDGICEPIFFGDPDLECGPCSNCSAGFCAHSCTAGQCCCASPPDAKGTCQDFNDPCQGGCNVSF